MVLNAILEAMKICFNQPYFIPWGGFYARLLSSDKMVLLDDTLLARGFTYVTRNRIKSPTGEKWISVPLKRKDRGRQKIKDLVIYEKARWRKDFLMTLQHFYKKSIFFESLFDRTKTALETPDGSFFNMVYDLLNLTKDNFDIDKEMIIQSKIGITGKGTPLLVSLAKELKASEVILPYFSQRAIECGRFKKEKIQVFFLRYSPPRYPQFWGSFVKNLSALDLLFCMGKNGRKIVERGIYLSKYEY